MREAFTVAFAGLNIGVESRYAFMRRFCRDYLADGEPCFSVRADEAAVKRQSGLSEEPVTEEYAEALCLYREMAERLPLYDRAVFHAAAIEYAGKAYLFTAPSGTGKSTHIRLWRELLGERVQIINGDKPILHRTESGVVVCGTPYAGKEGWQTNCAAPLAGICFLRQGTKNSMVCINGQDAFLRLYAQTYRPRTEAAVRKSVELVRALSAFPCRELTCDISEEAVGVSYEALTGKRFRRLENEDQS